MRNPTGVVLASLVVAMSIVSASNAQRTPAGSLIIGSRVRITADTFGGNAIDGVMLALSRDSVTIRRSVWSRERREFVDTVVIARRIVREMEVSAGTRTYGMKGMLIGLAGGAVVGGASLLASSPSCGERSISCTLVTRSARLPLFAVGAIAGGALGLPIGGIIGLAISADDWVSMNHVSLADIGVAPSSHGISARVSFAIR